MTRAGGTERNGALFPAAADGCAGFFEKIQFPHCRLKTCVAYTVRQLGHLVGLEESETGQGLFNLNPFVRCDFYLFAHAAYFDEIR